MPCHQAIVMQSSSLNQNSEAGNEILKKIYEEQGNLISEAEEIDKMIAKYKTKNKTT